MVAWPPGKETFLNTHNIKSFIQKMINIPLYNCKLRSGVKTLFKYWECSIDKREKDKGPRKYL